MKALPLWTAAWLSVVMIASLSLTACGQKKEDSSASRGTVSGTPKASTQAGRYVDNQGFYLNPGSGNFEQAVKDMLSAKFDPSLIGSIDNQSVIVTGYVEIMPNNQINTSVSKLKIWIKDSYAKVGFEGVVLEPYYIEINGAASGSANGSQYNTIFRNEFWEIAINGNYDANQISGNLSVRNLKDGSNSGQIKNVGTLGYFSVAACAFMNCK